MVIADAQPLTTLMRHTTGRFLLLAVAAPFLCTIAGCDQTQDLGFDNAGGTHPAADLAAAGSADLKRFDFAISPTDLAAADHSDTDVDAAPDLLPGPDLGCSPGKTFCDLDCVNLLSNHQNCSQCGMVCSDTQQCVNGACVACPNNGIFCFGQGCVTQLYDNNNCGACNKVCNTPTDICLQGQCKPCPFSICNNQCVSTFENHDNCGMCGKVCGMNQVCSMTNCLDCVAPSVICGNRCSNLMTSKQDCGMCANPCFNQQTCVNGKCQ